MARSKHVRCLPVLAAICAQHAWSQGTTNISGTLDVAYISSTSGHAKRTAIESGTHDASLIIFQGAEPLGNGITAIYGLEYGLAVDSNAGIGVPQFGLSSRTRNTFVGLSGDFGKLQAGRLGSPINSERDYDAAGATKFSPLIALLPDVVTYQADPTRLSNAIRYISPVMKGIWVMAAYSTAPFSDDSIASTNKPERAASVGISYSSGRFSSYYSYQEVSNRALLPIAANITDHALGVAYDFEIFKLMGVALTTRRDGTTTRRAIDLLTLGAIVPVSSNSMLRLDIGQLHDRTLANANATSWMVGYDYHLSKRTMLYLGYNTLTNQLNSAYAADTNNRPLPGSNAKLAGLGVRHNF